MGVVSITWLPNEATPKICLTLLDLIISFWIWDLLSFYFATITAFLTVQNVDLFIMRNWIHFYKNPLQTLVELLISSYPSLPIKDIVKAKEDETSLFSVIFSPVYLLNFNWKYFFPLLWRQAIYTAVDLTALRFYQHYKVAYSLYVYIFINMYEEY